MRKFLAAIRPAVAADGSKVFVLWTTPFDFLEFQSRSEAKAFVKARPAGRVAGPAGRRKRGGRFPGVHGISFLDPRARRPFRSPPSVAARGLFITRKGERPCC